MFRQLLLLALAVSCAAFSAPLSAVARSSANLQMNTAYTVAAGLAKKKGKTGDSSALKGYTVGSRAPKASVSSGEKNRFGYGIDNLYGGKVTRKSEPDLKGVIKADASSALGKAGIAWVGLTGLWVLSNLGPQ